VTAFCCLLLYVFFDPLQVREELIRPFSSAAERQLELSNTVKLQLNAS
jgi:hypothetical protein